MKIINFSHPFTAEQLSDITAALGAEPEVVDVPVRYDMDADLPAQALAYLKSACKPYEPYEDIVVRYPAMAGELMAVICYGYLGYIPAQVVIRAAPGPIRRFDFLKIENLTDVRNMAWNARRKDLYGD